MTTLGLYYPFIHFKDDEWLKLAALYWDRMARIVPASYPRVGDSGLALKRDSETARQLAEEVGFIVNVTPSETYPVFGLFGELLTRHAGALRERYGVQDRAAWPADPITAAYAQMREPQLAYVHSAKLDRSLIQRLEEEELAVGHLEGEELWAGMHPRLAAVYMSALAEDVANANGLHPATDETLDHIAATGWSLPRLAAALLDEPALTDEAGLASDDQEETGSLDEELSAALALVSFRAVAPKDPAALTIEKIAAVRKQFGGELSRFQGFVSELASELPEFGPNADPAAIAAHLDAKYKAEVHPVMSELESALRRGGTDTALTAVSTSIAMPPVLAEIAMPDPLATAAAVGFSIVPVVRARRRQTQELYRQSPVAYLYRVREELEPTTLLGWVRDRIRQVFTGL